MNFTFDTTESTSALLMEVCDRVTQACVFTMNLRQVRLNPKPVNDNGAISIEVGTPLIFFNVLDITALMAQDNLPNKILEST